jgi:hypothetical protein
MEDAGHGVRPEGTPPMDATATQIPPTNVPFLPAALLGDAI